MEYLLSNLNEFIPGLPGVNYENKSLRKCVLISLAYFSYIMGYIYLSKFAKACLIHEAVPRLNKERIISGLWRLIFAVWTIVIFWYRPRNLKLDNFQYNFLQDVTSPHCNLTTFQTSNTEDTSWENALVSAPIAFFLHQLYISLTSNVEPAIATMSGLAIFVISANYLKCLWLSLQVLFFLAVNVGSMELAKILYALKSRHRGYSGPPAPTFFRVSSPPVFAFHIILWAIINFYLFPSFILSLPSVTEVHPQYRLATMYVNIFLIFFAKQQFFCSPQWSLLKLLVRRSSGMCRTVSTQSMPSLVLLPYSSSLITELRNIQLSYLCEAPPTSAERRKLRRKMLSSGKQPETTTPGESKKFSSDRAAELLSIVKCVSVLKRKMRHRYEQQNASEASSQEDMREMETRSSESNGAASVDTSDEIFDIFIPVPTTSLSAEGLNGTEELSQGSLDVSTHINSPASDQQSKVLESEEPQMPDTCGLEED